MIEFTPNKDRSSMKITIECGDTVTNYILNDDDTLEFNGSISPTLSDETISSILDQVVSDSNGDLDFDKYERVPEDKLRHVVDRNEKVILTNYMLKKAQRDYCNTHVVKRVREETKMVRYG